MNCNPAFGQENYVKGTTKYCTGTNVNVREEANTDSKILGQLQPNTSVEAIEDNNGWTCITTQDGIAYVYSEYLSNIEVNVSENRWGITLSDDDFDMLCRIVMLESGGECDRGQQAVTEVILNRVAREDFPNDIISVLSQKDGGYIQFSTWKNRNSSKATPSEKVVENVRKVIHGETNIFSPETVYFSRKGENRRVQAVIGEHIFCNK